MITKDMTRHVKIRHVTARHDTLNQDKTRQEDTRPVNIRHDKTRHPTCTCDASSLGMAADKAVRRLEAWDVCRCSAPSTAPSSSSSSISRPKIPVRLGQGGPQPGGSSCEGKRAAKSSVVRDSSRGGGGGGARRNLHGKKTPRSLIPDAEAVGATETNGIHVLRSGYCRNYLELSILIFAAVKA